MSLADTIDLAKALIRCRSIAPQDDGAQAVIKDRLRPLGFQIHEVPCHGRLNFWAERGHTGPLFAIAIHTDVVPEGDAERWTSPPFEPEVREGRLYGRGAVDMKTQIACVIGALEETIRTSAPEFPNGFRFGLFVTGDEEPEENYGAKALLDHLEANGRAIDYALVTEPSSQDTFGDTVKIGRRGSIHGRVCLYGEQRHSSYHDQSINPIYRALPVFSELAQLDWCHGNEHFPPTGFQFTSIQANGGATNTTPGTLAADFNLRFSNELTAEIIQKRVEALLHAHRLDFSLEWICNAHPFLTVPGPYSRFVCQSVGEITGFQTNYSTSGGTSDGRFIAARGGQVVEFGFVGAKSHMIDECAPLDEIEKLQHVYTHIITDFARFARAIEA